MRHDNMFPAHIYSGRRAVLRKRMKSGKILLLGNEESAVNFADNWYPFRQDSTFLYYFGVSIAGLVGVIDCDQGVDYLVGDDLGIDDVVWTGPQPSMSDWAAKSQVEHTVKRTQLPSLLQGDVHYLPPYRAEHSAFVQALLDVKSKELLQGISIPLIRAVVKQRNIKSAEEIDELDRAVSITSKMHLEVMRGARPGMKEHELVGLASNVAHRHDVNFSFQPILTTNGQTLHNHYHGNTMHDGDMILFDGGTESHKSYAGDMTRTFPVGPRFSSRQKELYNIVLSAHETAVAALKPGIKFLDVHLMAAQKLVEGLCSVGLMKGDPAEAVALGAHTMFFQCGLGHMMGLDVHDMENLGEQYVGYTDQLKKSKEFGLKSLRLGRELEAGFVLTVEPGIYIIPELIDLFKSSNKYTDFINYNELDKYRDFGGIRIEEDFVMTEDGSKLLGTELAKSSVEIEEIRKQALS